jgi:hypothetical protein
MALGLLTAPGWLGAGWSVCLCAGVAVGPGVASGGRRFHGPEGSYRLVVVLAGRCQLAESRDAVGQEARPGAVAGEPDEDASSGLGQPSGCGEQS